MTKKEKQSRAPYAGGVALRVATVSKRIREMGKRDPREIVDSWKKLERELIDMPIEREIFDARRNLKKELIDMTTGFSDEEALGVIGFHGKMRSEGIFTVWRGLLTFAWEASAFRAAPQCPFKPHGLIIWGAPPLATINLHVGNRIEVTVSYPPAPARFFAMGDNFEQIAKLLDEGKEPPAWCSWSACEPGHIVTAAVQSHEGKSLGPDDGIELCMWGHAIR